MVAYFFDSSALAKRYVTETGTRWVQSLTDPAAGNPVYVARITLVELVAAISRRRKSGDLTPADADAALADVRADFISDYQVIEVTAALIAQAEALAERHALRGYDAVQLAAALEVNAAYLAAGQPPVTLVSADLGPVRPAPGDRVFHPWVGVILSFGDDQRPPPDVRLICELLARRYPRQFFELLAQPPTVLLRRIAADELAAGTHEGEQDCPEHVRGRTTG